VVGPSSDSDANPETGTLYAIYIDPNYMGQGIGSQLMAKGLETLKVQNFKEATLWVLDTNAKTRRFYESRDWAEDGAKKTEPGDGFDLNETRYRISLATITEPIILIGPMKAGKTTVGRLLAEKLACPFTSLDRLERGYTVPVGFDESEAAAIHQQQGVLAWYSYRRAFFDEAVVRFLAEYTTGVLELGGGHPIVPDEAKQQRIAEALASYRHVILLLPTPDIQEALKILCERQKPEHRNPDLNELFLADDRFFRLAKQVVYTEGKTPAEICEEIARNFSLAIQ
jgi:shikimate kinase